MIYVGRCRRCGAEIYAPYRSGVLRFMKQGYCSTICRRLDELDAEALKPEVEAAAPSPALIRAVAVLREYSDL